MNDYLCLAIKVVKMGYTAQKTFETFDSVPRMCYILLNGGI